MGVPGFVAWLYKNHKNSNFIFKNLFTDSNIDINSVEYLLIDTNCLIHPQARNICLEYPNLVESNLELLESKIIKQVIKYIEMIILELNPTKTVYIAIDGVAPMAKIKHQRLRRFKSAYDTKMNEELLKKHNRPIQKQWNTSAITPGTTFMDKLMRHILNWINKNEFKCQIIFSSSYTPGEGEHKILQYVKTATDIVEGDNIVIYGLDADLLFLSLALEKNRIFLMRETSQMEIDTTKCDEGFSYLSIDTLKDIIYAEMTIRLSKTREWSRLRIINDFVFLCYFCGNDFLPNIPSLTIKPHNRKIINGIDTIIQTYTTVMDNQVDLSKYLIHKDGSNGSNDIIHIDQQIFLDILKDLSDQETVYFNDHFKFKRQIRYSDQRDPYLNEKHNYEENIIKDYHDPIQLGDPLTKLSEWKQKYYKTYFNVDISDSSESLNEIIDEYIHGMIWTTHYYYSKCKNYEWFYEYHNGPFISDILNYLTKHPDRISYYENLYSVNGIWFENMIKPLHQLMLVLPHESSYLLPSIYRNLMYSNKLKKYFPDRILDIKFDYLYKNKAWQNTPMIEIIDPNQIINLTSQIVTDEYDRNKLYNIYVK
jgi:5'-3' exonuclease